MLMATAWSATAQELSYWSVWSEPEPQAQVLKHLFEEYSAAHPGVTITPVWIGRQNLVQLRSHLFAGNTADIVDGDARQYLGLALKEDFFVDLKGLADELKDSVLPNTVSLMAENGIQYGIPYIHNAVVFLYIPQSIYNTSVYMYATGFGQRGPIFQLGYASAIGVETIGVSVILVVLVRRMLNREVDTL